MGDSAFEYNIESFPANFDPVPVFKKLLGPVDASPASDCFFISFVKLKFTSLYWKRGDPLTGGKF